MIKMKTISASSLILSLVLLRASSSLVSQPRENCVLDADGSTNCVPNSSMSSVVHAGGAAPCAREDVMCWCKMAKDYTNEVRRKNGVSPMLKLGTQSQMDNAMKYAKKLGEMGYLEHQELSKVTKEVGCQRWMGGENLAFNYETGDIAKMCVDQWVGSKGHYENLVRDWFEEVVIGFHFEPDGRVYCVQTFALPYPSGTFGSASDKGCEVIGGSTPISAPDPGAGSEPTTRPPTTQPPTTRPPTTRASPAPRAETMSVTTAPASCTCLRYGKGCKADIAMNAGNGCVGGAQRSKQPRSCKMNCCQFCKNHPSVGECSHRHLKRICGKV